jgi:Trk-type K+ transport system membrane component
MNENFEINKKYYKWDISKGDYHPDIDDSYKKYKHKQKIIKRAFIFSAIAILVSSIIVFLATR